MLQRFQRVRKRSVGEVTQRSKVLKGQLEVGWGSDAEVKSNCLSSGGPELGSQQPTGLQPLVTPAAGVALFWPWHCMGGRGVAHTKMSQQERVVPRSLEVTGWNIKKQVGAHYPRPQTALGQWGSTITISSSHILIMLGTIP